jgi:hypothetical protein
VVGRLELDAEAVAHGRVVEVAGAADRRDHAAEEQALDTLMVAEELDVPQVGDRCGRGRMGRWSAVARDLSVSMRSRVSQPSRPCIHGVEITAGGLVVAGDRRLHVR